MRRIIVRISTLTKRSRLPLIFLILFVCSPKTVLCQTRPNLSGQVTDSLQRPITGASITLHAADSSILSFSRSQLDGRFTISIGTAGAAFLRASALGYASKDYALPPQPPYPDSILFILTASTIELKEVNIHARQAITERGDTITYRLESFTDQTERALEEALAKLPGFAVSDDGTIRINGQPIRKILVEGDDLLDHNYKLLSKNLSAGLVDEVDVINHYLDNPILKGVEHSEDLALNVKLKDKSKKILTGDVAVDGGTPDRYGMRSNLILLSPKTKIYTLLNGNNYGEDINPDFHSPYAPVSNTLSHPFAPNMTNQQLLSIQLPTVALVDKKLTLFNRARLASTNLVHKTSEKLQVKGNLHYFEDRNLANAQQRTVYYTVTDTFRVDEVNDFVKRPTWLSTDANLRYTPNGRTSLEYKFSYQHGRDNNYNALLFNEHPIEQRLKTDTRQLDTRINFVTKTSINGALVADAAFIDKKLPQTFYVSEFYAPSAGEDGHEALQQSADNLRYLGGQLKYLGSNRAGKKRFGMALSYDDYHEKLNSQLATTAELNDAFGNESELHRNKASVQAHHQEDKGQWDFSIKGGINYQSLKLLDNLTGSSTFDQHELYPNVDANANWRLSTGHRLALSYGFDQELPLMNNLYGNYILTNYRSAARFLPQKNNIYQHRSVLRYTLNNALRQFSANFSLGYFKLINGYSQILEVSPSFVGSTGFPVGYGNQIASLNGGLDKFVPQLNLYVKVQSNNSNNRFVNQLNEQERRVSLWILGNQITLSSVFSGPFNFRLYIKNYLSINSAQNTETGEQQATRRNTTWQYNFQLKYNLAKKLIASLEPQYFSWTNANTSSHVFLMEANAEWFAIENKLSFRITARNLTDRKILLFSSISDYQSFESSYMLQPRTILIGAKYHF